MNIEQLDSLEDLRICLAEHEQGINSLDNRFAEHEQGINSLDNRCKELQTVAKSGMMSAAADQNRITNKQFGALIKTAAHKGNDETKRIIDGMQGKALLGTPLVIDSGTGTYLIPEQYIEDIFAILTESSEVYPLVHKIPMISNSAKYPSKLAGISFTRITSDAVELTEQAPTFSEIDMNSETFGLWISVTENFLNDNLVTVGDYFRQLVQEAWVASVETCILNNSSNPTGLLQNTSANIYRLATDSINDIDVEDLYAMVEELTTLVKRKGGVFFMHPLIWDKVRQLTDANGNPIIAPWVEAAARRLFGYNVVLSDQMPSADAADTAFIAFGNPNHLLVGERQGIELKFFGETAQAAKYQEVFFRGTYRASFAVGDAGAFAILKTAA